MDHKLNFFVVDEKVMLFAYDMQIRRLGRVREILFKFKEYWELKIIDVGTGVDYCVLHFFDSDEERKKVDKASNSVQFILED